MERREVQEGKDEDRGESRGEFVYPAMLRTG
jgi:hypothetical protein